ncbi:MAG: class I SAM-dependent methyltransferase [Haloarculaceae archaeon]
MPRSAPFERHTDRYEDWFEGHEAAYESELAALGDLRPDPGHGLEIGVGTGRFAAPLGFEVGLDPAGAMLAVARDRGIAPIRGVAEDLPFGDRVFDSALLVTTVCFVDDLEATLREARRVLAPDGAVLVGYIDRESPVGEIYLERKEANPFYREATFVSTDELLAVMEDAGFGDIEAAQTVFSWPGEMTEPDPVVPGYGDGSFVAIRGMVE